MLPIEATDRARRLGNVAAILIDLARRAQVAKKEEDVTSPALKPDGQVDREAE